MADNFEAVDLSWVKNAADPLEVLRQGLDFLEDPSKINNYNGIVQRHVLLNSTGYLSDNA